MKSKKIIRQAECMFIVAVTAIIKPEISYKKQKEYL